MASELFWDSKAIVATHWADAKNLVGFVAIWSYRNDRVVALSFAGSSQMWVVKSEFTKITFLPVRRELIDQTLFWTATDLENKLRKYQCCFNESRTHSGLSGATPVDVGAGKVVDINNCRWKKHYRGLFELPMAAWICNSPGTRPAESHAA